MNNILLKWWINNVLVVVCMVIAGYFGLYKEIWLKDSSYLCFVIIGLYFLSSGYNGKLAYEIDRGKKVMVSSVDFSWFMSEMCLSLGMIGTVIGFIQMLQGFSDAPEGSAAIKKLITSMSYGMSTALYTTLAGLICGNIVKLQCFNLEKALEGKCQDTETSDPKPAS
jgi:ABC-type Fe3+ transport system permease subunit